MNPKSDVCNWLGPKSPFVRVHVDHFFFGGKAIFLVVDAYSKWVELSIQGTPTTDTGQVYFQFRTSFYCTWIPGNFSIR